MEPVRWALLGFLFLVCRATEFEPEGDAPMMLSVPSNLRALVNDTVVLPCKVANIGLNVRVWKQMPSNLLFSGNIAVSRDPRIRLGEESSLQISQVTPEYAGEYVCQVSRHPKLNVVHKIQVLVPPSVVPDPPLGKVVVRKGDPMSIRCNVSGIPKPVVTWTYGDEQEQISVLPSGVRQLLGGQQLHVTSADVLHAGLYRCSAENDVGQPASASFHLSVHYAPEVLIKPEWAHGDEGASVEFVCTVRSVPVSHVEWQQGDRKNLKQLREGERIKMRHRAPESSTIQVSLKVQRLRKQDLGPYTCSAKNSVGQSWKTVEISGLAEPAHLRGNETSDTSFLLLWTVTSYSPIIEYQLKIRPHRSGEQWTNVVIPVAGEEQSLLYSHSYEVSGLQPGITYEAVLQAHNDFGWNRPSDTFLFKAGTSPSPQTMMTVVEPSQLPLYEADLDITDPPYLVKSSSTYSRIISWPLVYVCVLLMCLL